MPQLDFILCMGCMETLEEQGTCPRCGYSPDQANPPSYLAAGTMLADRYIVGRMLRYNGEGAEYIGYDTGTAAKVTIREYMPDTLCTRKDSMLSVRSSSVAQYKAFMSEFVELNKTLAKMRTLSHINPPIDMFGENNTGYVVFKYIEGINLGKYLKANSGELTWEEVRDSFPPIFTTLSLVHNAGLIHRGISPDNIIVGRDGNMKLIGFSIADARTAETELRSELYRGYAAPEQYSSSNWQGTWTDVYGISALLYRILTGTAPMDAKDRMANDALPEPKALNSDIPANVSRVIMDGLELSGEKRIQTVTEFVTRLFEEPEPSRKKTVTQTVSIPKQRKTSEKAPKSKDQRGKVFWIVLFASALVMMVVLSIVIMSLDDNSANGLMGVTTPTKLLTDAMTSESDTGLPEITDPDVTEIPRDTSSGMSALPTLAVIETTTASGEESSSTSISVKNGGTVYIMNDLTGKTFDMIKNTAVNDNLNLIPDYIYTDAHERGIIFAQSIEKGTPYEKGQECVISISLGPGIAVVPDYTGLSRKDYFDLLNSRGIKYEEKSYETEDVLNGYVAWIGMEPGDEINIEEGEILEVFIAKNNRTETTTVSTTIVTIPTVPEPTAWITTEPIVFTPEPEPEPFIPDPGMDEPEITLRGDY